ncbi:expressed unknown protein [Seminavis robusta]|uniref:Uncharacterized protein n=1 Tax=Seminavis robusta TaxID=568900 RepID=A0A9N8DD33_9STRA|nr:expressed unknown protein [Seminavis robusta]|eukprot:Sro91_g047780.1 n/a (230) ;mRNA; r:83756-84445
MNRRPPSTGIDFDRLGSGNSFNSIEACSFQLDNLQISRVSPNNTTSTQAQQRWAGYPVHHCRPRPLLHVPGPLRCSPITEEDSSEGPVKKRSSVASSCPWPKDPMSLRNDTCDERQRKKRKQHRDDLPLDLSLARIMPSPVPVAFPKPPRSRVDSAALETTSLDDAVSQHSSVASSEGVEESLPIIQPDRFQYLLDFLRQAPASNRSPPTRFVGSPVGSTGSSGRHDRL